MKHRQKWKVCGTEEVRLDACSALNVHVGVVALSPASSDETQTPSRWGKKPTRNTDSSGRGPNGTGGRTRCPGSVTARHTIGHL